MLALQEQSSMGSAIVVLMSVMEILKNVLKFTLFFKTEILGKKQSVLLV